MNFLVRQILRNPKACVFSAFISMLGTSLLLFALGFRDGVMTLHKQSVLHTFDGHGQIATRSLFANEQSTSVTAHWLHEWKRLEGIKNSTTLWRHIFWRQSLNGFLYNGSERSTVVEGEGVDSITEGQYFSPAALENVSKRVKEDNQILRGSNLSGKGQEIILGYGVARTLGLDLGDTATLLTKDAFGSLAGGGIQSYWNHPNRHCFY